jgi:uncharacterized protein YrrD
MKRSVKSLIGSALGAKDGEIGKVKEFYFHDSSWIIRYFVVDTGNWLTGRVVLIAPEALDEPDWKKHLFPTHLSQDQIRHSPSINTDIPVSRQEEIKLYTYYPWAAYWQHMNYFDDSELLDTGRKGLNESIRHSLIPENNDEHLRSTDAVTGYSIKTNDGEIGTVEDFIIDVIEWKIDFLVIDIGKWLSDKKVLLPLDKIKNIDWSTGTISIDTTIEKVKHSPSYDFENEFTDVYSLVL